MLSAKETQEFLCLAGYQLVIDGEIGPATLGQIRLYQEHHGLKVTGEVDEQTEYLLRAPIRQATALLEPHEAPFPDLVVAYARQHLRQHPREVGGDNRGPWVRLYMGGGDGPNFQWCGGFAAYILRQAAATLNRLSPIPWNWQTQNCNEIARIARDSGLLTSDPAQAYPGCLVLYRSQQIIGQWRYHHVAIYEAMGEGKDHFFVIGGNTNGDNSDRGFEVARVSHGFGGKDYVVIA